MKRALVLISLCCGAAALLWAGGFWEKKKFPNWSEKDIQKMVKNSPWARPVDISMGAPSVGGGGGRGRGGRGGGGRGGGGTGMDASGGGVESGGGGADAGGFGSTADPGGGGFSAPSLTAIVRCHSALPIKQAIQLSRFGEAVTANPEAQQIFARQESHYVFGIEGLPGGLMRGAKPEELKDKAFLKVKNKDAVAAEAVKVDRTQTGLYMILFFPRKDHVIMLEDGEVELLLKLPATNIKRSFKLKEMVYEGRLEI